MKDKKHEVFRIIIFFIFVVMVAGSACYYKYSYEKKYNSIFLETVKSRVIEYGSANYNIGDLVNSVNGDIVSVKKNIDTSKVGIQSLVLELKMDNVYKDISIDVEIKDTIAPVIDLYSREIIVERDSEIDFSSNIVSVYDYVDGELEYFDKDLINDKSFGYYTIDTDLNIDVCGKYNANVVAVDNHGNSSSETFSITVIDSNLSNNLANIALSLVGSPYVYGGVSPNGFDCSGFVQYVYRQVGLNVSRSANTQIYDGYGINYNEAMPGDILSWGYSNGVVTHSAIYIGNGNMVHAANPSQGVLISNVDNWQRGSDVEILGVRRVN